MTAPEDHRCPECNNDIYKPFTYCTSCGWEKSEEDKEAKPAKKPGKGKKGKKKGKTAEVRTVPCPKCKGKVPVESDERPITIVCPSCGTKGTLKAKPGKEKQKEKEGGKETPPEEEEKVKEKDEDAVDEEKDEEREAEEVKKKPAKKKKAVEGYKKVIKCPACKEDIIIRTKKRPVRIECESCGKTGTLKK